MNEHTNTSTNQTAPKAFDIIDGNTLMAQEYEPLQFAVEKILPRGLFSSRATAKSESPGCPSTSTLTWRLAASCGIFLLNKVMFCTSPLKIITRDCRTGWIKSKRIPLTSLVWNSPRPHSKSAAGYWSRPTIIWPVSFMSKTLIKCTAVSPINLVYQWHMRLCFSHKVRRLMQ